MNMGSIRLIFVACSSSFISFFAAWLRMKTALVETAASLAGKLLLIS